MYERSVIVLERYMEKILEYNKQYNLKKNTQDYKDLVNEIDNYQRLEEKGIKIIQEFDDIVRKIENIQKEQKKIYSANKKIEETRTQLFQDLGEDAKILENKIKKAEEVLDKNNDRLKQLREQFIHYLSSFSQKQKDRNICDKERRTNEEKYIAHIRKANEEFKQLDIKDIVILKDFISSEKEKIKEEVLNLMIKNGKNERIPFNQDVLKKAITNRFDIAEKEAQCYIEAYEKMKKLLSQVDNENIKLDKYKKSLDDIIVRLAFLNAQREYIIEFLDYERMTTISGSRTHKKMMIDACNNFELDMMQIRKLYELLLKEIDGKVIDSDYEKLYNKNYLKNIEDKEKNFEKEANNVDIEMGTLINSNYWRIDGIKNIYKTFHKEVSEKFNRDLSKYKIDGLEDDINYKNTYDEKNDDYEEENYNVNTYDYEDDYFDDKDIYIYDDNEYSEEDIYEYKYEEAYDKNKEQNNDDDNEEEYDEFDSDDLDKIIKNSRKKGLQEEKKANKNDSKSIFNKFFRK